MQQQRCDERIAIATIFCREKTYAEILAALADHDEIIARKIEKGLPMQVKRKLADSLLL